MLITIPQKIHSLKTSLEVYINNLRVPNSVCEKLLGVLGVVTQDNFDWTSHVKKVNNTCGEE